VGTNAEVGTDAEVETFELELETQNGRRYTGRILGEQIAYDDARNMAVYLTAKGNVVLYAEDKPAYYVIEYPQVELVGVLGDDTYLDAMEALGLKPEPIDLDL
jgi:hypothetical protein